MANEMYFVLRTSEDGLYIDANTKEELLQTVKEWQEEDRDIEICSELPTESWEYWGTKAVIIKGEIVVPRAKKMVTVFDIN